MAPENKPPVPSPAKARPTIKASLVGAVAQTKELQIAARLANAKKRSGRTTHPSSKIAMAVIYVYLI